MEFDVAFDEIVARYNGEVARLTQRAVLAEARADAAEKALQEASAEAN